MKSFKRIIALVMVVALTAAVAIGGTLAYLTMDAGEEHNVFSVGNIDVSLDEEVGIYGEGGEVKETEDGAEYIEVMPGDYLQKEVTVTNNGKTDAYVAVTVTLNNALEINNAIDKHYEDLGYTAEEIQAIYDNIFDGWGINYNPRPGAEGVNDARGVIDGTYGLPEHVLHVDFAKTTAGSTLIGANNWFIAGSEKAGQYWVDGPKAYDGYYTADMEDYEICYTYYLYLPAGESSTLFEGLNVPAEFDAEQLKMFDGLEINIEAAAIQADNMAVAKQYIGDENGEAKTAFAILAGDIETPEYSAKPTGTVTYGFTSMPSGSSLEKIWGDATTNAKESVVVKIYSGNTYLGSTSLNDVDNIIDGNTKTVTWSIALDGESSDYWTMNWEKKPTINTIPTAVELWVDGEKVDENTIKMSASDDLNPVTGVVTDANGVITKFVTKNYTVQDGENYVPFISGSDALNAALAAGQTNLYLLPGEYTVDSAKGQTLTISGSKDAVIKVENESGAAYTNPSDGTGVDYSFDGSTVTFNGVTIDTTENGGTYPSFARLTAVYNNCTINGSYVLGEGNSTFNNCTLNVSGDKYNIWTWGANNVTFSGCTINCDGKAILVYNQTTNVSLTNCVLNDNGGLADEQKAAIETGADNATSATYNIYINNTTVNGFNTTEQKSITFGGTSFGTNVWGNKNLIDADHLNVVIDGNDVY